MTSRQLPTQAMRTPLLAGYTRRSARGAPSERYLQRLPLAGFEHHAAARLWPYLRAGQALVVARELSNPADRRAVCITWLGEHLGYLPRADNFLASDLLDHGAEVIARIHTLRDCADPWARMDLDLYLGRSR
jgi:hypothetical protein